ncbi:arylamine N-acetyltransferase family protein [Paenibacillus nasutitermitis]|uniref:N-hydroxyarylamine O-acetyltransferase n=1 Tax=Paenibacillus nasutitermitis TaxID=1652958 RepID=A0A916YPG1_9BACL|nr:arylamine N-acetyltransferase [Paenibacillus nasutitermitis]GGD54889.1 N-hydroxyarylamine O-acetyltransferase [Paenibacillus nasutitermitis]
MSEFNVLFRQRIGISASEKITFENLDHVLENMAKTVPFENLRILKNNTDAISKNYLMEKILINHEGGLCYELNPLLCLFLIENGFNAVLTCGIVFNQEAQQYSGTGRTHFTILLTHEDQIYLIDTGFGGNLPLRPVPLTGEVTSSANGQFRVKKINNEHGDYTLEMILKHKDTDWKLGYAFDSAQTTTEISEGSTIKQIISEHPESTFNKKPLVTKLTNAGSITLTDSSLTQWQHGTVTKINIEKSSFPALLKQHFDMSIPS